MALPKASGLKRGWFAELTAAVLCVSATLLQVGRADIVFNLPRSDDERLWASVGGPQPGMRFVDGTSGGTTLFPPLPLPPLPGAPPPPALSIPTLPVGFAATIGAQAVVCHPGYHIVFSSTRTRPPAITTTHSHNTSRTQLDNITAYLMQQAPEPDLGYAGLGWVGPGNVWWPQVEANFTVSCAFVSDTGYQTGVCPFRLAADSREPCQPAGSCCRRPAANGTGYANVASDGSSDDDGDDDDGDDGGGDDYGGGDDGQDDDDPSAALAVLHAIGLVGSEYRCECGGAQNCGSTRQSSAAYTPTLLFANAPFCTDTLALYFGHNNLVALPVDGFAGLVNLLHLQLSFNQLSDLPIPPGSNTSTGWLADCRALVSLDLSFNLLSRVKATDFEGARALEGLDLSRNLIDTIESSALANLNLTHLDLSSNRLTSVANLTALDALTFLNLNENAITFGSSDFARMTAMEVLQLKENNFTALPRSLFSSMSVLERLDLADNGLVQIPTDLFASTIRLETLDLRNNAIETIADGAFQSLAQIETIYLQGNRLVEISSVLFRGATALETLDLSNNALRQILPGTFQANTRLSNLDLHSNALAFIAQDLASFSVPFASEAPVIPLQGNILTGCFVRSDSVNCSGCAGQDLILRESAAFECCILDGFSSCDSAARFGLQVNTTFDFTPPLASIPELFVGEAYRFEAPRNKSALFRDFAGNVNDITYKVTYMSRRPPQGDVLIAPESGIVLVIASASGTGEYSAEFMAVDSDSNEVVLAIWNYSVVVRPDPEVNPNVSLVIVPALPSRLSINQSYSFQPTAVSRSTLTPITNFSEIYVNMAGDSVSFRLDMRNRTSSAPFERVGDFLVDTSTGFVSVRPIGVPYNATVNVTVVDGAGRELLITSWVVQVLYRDTFSTENGPGGVGCLNGGIAIDTIEHDRNFVCACDNTLYTGANCEDLRGVPQLRVTFAGQATDISGLPMSFYNTTEWAVGQDYRIGRPIITAAETTSDSGIVANVSVDALTFTVAPLPPGFFFNPATGEIIGVFASPMNVTSEVTAHFAGASPSPPIAVIEFAALFPDVASPTNGPNGRDCLNEYEREDGAPFDGQFTCVCGTSSLFFGDNCDIPLPQPVLNVEVGPHYIPATGNANDYSFYNRTQWTIGESTRVAPVQILSANITRMLSSGVRITQSVAPSNVTFLAVPLPPGFFMDMRTGEMIGIPVNGPPVMSTLTANFAFAQAAVVTTMNFEVFPADTANAANGPSGRDCQSSDQRVDLNPYDGIFTCNCSATGAGFTGPNCDEPVNAATTSGGQDGQSSLKYMYAVAGALLFACLCAVVVLKVRLYRARRIPENLDEMQGEILKELGIGVIYDIAEHEVGVSIVFENLEGLNEDDDAKALSMLVKALQGLKGTQSVVWSSARVVVQLDEKRIMLVVTRPDGKAGQYFAEDLVSIIRKACTKEKLIAGKSWIVADAAVAVPKKVPREVERSSVLRLQVLGEGNFGEVFKALLNHSHRSMPSQVVAAKTVKSGSETTRADLLREAAVMSFFTHPNLVALIGVVTIPRTVPAIVLLEFCENGTLLDHVAAVDDTAHMLLTYCADVARGLRYLSSRSIVHRDIAARNILLDAAMHCKVADFGMSIALGSGDAADGGETYAANYVRLQGELPVRWSAIETLNEGKYSRATDVWSFGVLVYEVFSKATLPYSQCPTLMEVSEFIKAGRVLECPLGCPSDVYDRLMDPCWRTDPRERPGFTDLLRTCIDLGAGDEIHKTASPCGSIHLSNDEIWGPDSIKDRDKKKGKKKKKPKKIRGGGNARPILTDEERLLLGPSVHHLTTVLLPGVIKAATPAWLTAENSDEAADEVLRGHSIGTFTLVKSPHTSSGFSVAVVSEGGVDTIAVAVIDPPKTVTSASYGNIPERTFAFEGGHQKAVTLGQLLKMAMAETTAPLDRKLVPLRSGTILGTSLPDAPMLANIGHAVDLVVKPATKGIPCLRDGILGCSYVDFLEDVDDVGKAIALLSYTWTYKVVDVVQALNRWVASEGHRRIDTRRAYIWICSLCLNQHRMHKALSPEALAGEFGPRVVAIGRLLPMLDPWRTPAYVTRAWCLFELYTAIQKKVPISIILTEQQESSFLQAMATEGYGAMDDALRAIRSELATASFPEDLQAIHGYVKSVPGGFEQLDHKIKHHLQEWCASHGAVRSANRLQTPGQRSSGETPKRSATLDTIQTLNSSAGSRLSQTMEPASPFTSVVENYLPKSPSPDTNATAAPHFYPDIESRESDVFVLPPPSPLHENGFYAPSRASVGNVAVPGNEYIAVASPINEIPDDTLPHPLGVPNECCWVNLDDALPSSAHVDDMEGTSLPANDEFNTFMPRT